jgi:hypothetical protein
MTEPTHLAATRESYDTVAADYAERVPALFADDRLGRDAGGVRGARTRR